MLLLDEPFGALDAKVRKELRRWLRRLHDELHITSIFVTHDQEEALEVADRVVLMNHGQVEQVGTPTEVYEHPATPFVYGFLGAVNRFHGRVEGEQVRSAASSPHRLAGRAGRERRLRTTARTGIAPRRPRAASRPRVGRVLSFGAASRVELTGTTNQHIEVELARERAEALALQTGPARLAAAARLSVFEPTHAKESGIVRSMNFQQLRIIREAVQRNFNLTEVANALYTSQSGVSKHIKDLEDELGVELFVRKGKRLIGLTEPGKELVGIVERMLLDAKNIKRLAEQFANRDEAA